MAWPSATDGAAMSAKVQNPIAFFRSMTASATTAPSSPP